MDHQLEKFLSIVEYGSFTRAAHTMHVSQPALTVAVNELEKALGVKILNRKRGSFGLTDAGQIVYDTALRMRADMHAMQQILAEHSNTKRIVARVGLLDSVANLLFSSGDTTDNPMHNIEVRVDNSTRLIDEVKYGRLDMAVVVALQQHKLPDNITSTLLGTEQFVFVGRSEVVAATDPKHINNWLAVNQASNTYACFSAAFEQLGIVANPIFYSTSMELLKIMALRGKGIALLPLQYCRNEVQASELAFVNIDPISRPLSLVQPISTQASEPVQVLTERLEQLFMSR